LKLENYFFKENKMKKSIWLSRILLCGLLSTSHAFAHDFSKGAALEDQKQYTGKIAPKAKNSFKSPNDITFKILLEQANFENTPFELAEIIMPVGAIVNAHIHQSEEFIYVISGELEHSVAGRNVILKAGDIGIAPKGYSVTHKVLSKVPVKTLVIWTPTGEADIWRKLLSQSSQR